MHEISIERFPYGKRFTVTFVDDTDRAVLSEIVPVYRCLQEYGIKSTKTVWPLEASSSSGGYIAFPTDGDTLQKPKYRFFCQQLRASGFEIAMHTASAGDSKRGETIKAYRYFEDIFGHPPHTNVMHGRNRENLYWGKYCVPSPIISRLISLIEPLDFSGHQPDSEYYWGDICREKTRYVRQFENLSVDTLSFDPATPYHDPLKPDVPWWFSSSYGVGRRLFTLLSAHNLERLAMRRGASIIHTYLRHFAQYQKSGTYRAHHRFREVVELLASRHDGWYVPAVTLLDRLRALRSLAVRVNKNEIHFYNPSNEVIEDFALWVPNDLIIGQETLDHPLVRNCFGQVNVGKIEPTSWRRLVTNSERLRVLRLQCPSPNYKRLISGHLYRIVWQFSNGRKRFIDDVTPKWVRKID